MRTFDRPWKARGPVAWTSGGAAIAFFDADTIANGLSRLVVVPMGGGAGRQVGWIEGVPGSVFELSNGTWVYDSTPSQCPNDESERQTLTMYGGGTVEVATIQLGDPSVFNGYPFALSPDQRWSAHVGQYRGVGVVVVTELATGRSVALTEP